MCVTHALAVDREGSFESAPGVRIRRQVSQQRREIELTRSHRGEEIHGFSQQLLHTRWISLFTVYHSSTCAHFKSFLIWVLASYMHQWIESEQKFVCGIDRNV